MVAWDWEREREGIKDTQKQGELRKNERTAPAYRGMKLMPPRMSSF